MDAPTISPFALRFFRVYARRYVAKQFHALRLAHEDEPVNLGEGPAIVYLNHSSWWDPLIAMLLAAECFQNRPSFAPMDARQLERYGIFRKLGVFGVEQSTKRGARDFLEASEAILTDSNAILWLTPQARFADVRERPLRFAAGLAGLARRFPNASFVPLAIEYASWSERLPEALARLGKAETGAELCTRSIDRSTLNATLETALASTMDALAAASIQRDQASFRSLLEGSAGVNPAYDFWRRLRGVLGGESFQAEHRRTSLP